MAEYNFGIGPANKKHFIIKMCSWLGAETLDTANFSYSYYSPIYT
jgi:hypothetical protein